MEANQPIDERYIADLESHIKRARDAADYSANRFDILLISLSSTALILSIGNVGKLVPNISEVDTLLLKLAWALFVACLLFNLISQITGYYAHVYDIKYSKGLIRKERGKKTKSSHESSKKLNENNNRATIWLNRLSFGTFFLGIVFLVVFFSIEIN